MRLPRRIAAALTALVLGALGAPAVAGAQSLCRVAADGPLEYQVTLAPLVSGFVLAPGTHGEPPPPPPASTGVGAGNLARETLGAQFSGFWLNNAVQGWVVGLAPGPLDRAGARAAIVQRVAAHYTPAETAHLSERLHIDPQPYGEVDLHETEAAVSARLGSEARGTYWGTAIGCTLSDHRRVEVSVYPPSTTEQLQRVGAALAPFGDRVRVAPSGRLAAAPPAGGPSRAVVLGRHVRMPTALRCVRTRQVSIAARRSRPAVRSLTVRAGGRSKTIAGRRLAKALKVSLRGTRTRIVVTVRLTDGRAATRAVTYRRCR